MPLSKDTKATIIAEYKRADADTGSTEVQVALLTQRIRDLTEHLKSHQKDVGSRYGLIRMVSARRRLLDYLKRKNEARYQSLIKELGIRR